MIQRDCARLHLICYLLIIPFEVNWFVYKNIVILIFPQNIMPETRIKFRWNNFWRIYQTMSIFFAKIIYLEMCSFYCLSIRNLKIIIHNYFTTLTLNKVYIAHIYSHIIYVHIYSSNGSKTKIKEIQRLQKNYLNF